MNPAAGQAVNRLLNHLAGSVVLEASEFEDDIQLLVDEAISATGVRGALDVDAILETLGHVAQWHADAVRP
jgi:hypothetical protein